MSHPLRWYVPGMVYEVTSRTIQERFLLRPGPRSRELINGVIARAQRLFPLVMLHAYTYLSNHAHLLLSTECGAQLAEFLGYVNSNVARELGRLHGWRGAFWGRRPKVIPVLDEASMIARLRYVLAQGVKEGLVDCPEDWPGASSTPGLLGGTIRGVWIDRDTETRARKRPGPVDASRFTTENVVELTPLPAWAALAPGEQQRRVRELIADIVKESRHSRRGASLGAARVAAQDPHARPDAPAESPAPTCHAADRASRVAFRRAYRAFCAAFRAVSRAVTKRDDARLHDFPPGSFPRSRWYVPVGPTWWPPWSPDDPLCPGDDLAWGGA